MTTTTAPESFVQPPQGRFAVGCSSIFFGLPAVGTSVALAPNGPLVAALPIAVGLGLVAAAYYVFSEEARVTLDARGLRLCRARVLLGRVRLSERVEWEIPLTALTSAREVHVKTPASRGGWQHTTRLQLPEGRTLDASTLGGAEDFDSPYHRLARMLEKRLGAAFERESRVA